MPPLGSLRIALEISDRNWEVVSVNFISGLTPSANDYDAIFVCVDKLSKMAQFMPTTTHITTKGTARLFRDHVYKIHSLPKVILSDRDARFTSRFWDALHGLLGTKLAMSTAFHPQTDGQTKRVNRILEDMLRHYVKPVQDDWDEFLVLVEFTYNNSWQESVGNTPFVLNYGQHPRTPISGNNRCQVPAAQNFVEHMTDVIGLTKKHLIDVQQRQKFYVNKHR